MTSAPTSSDPALSEAQLAQCLATLEALHQTHPSALASLPHVPTILAAGYSLARRAGSALRDPRWKRPRRDDEPPIEPGPRADVDRETPPKRRPFRDPEATSMITSLDERERASDERTLRCYLCDREYRGDPDEPRRECPECLTLVASKRARSADLRGRVALVTGVRVRIGYATALSLLRHGARVHGTTRFCASALERFSREPDFAQWSERLSLHALDLCDLRATERFAQSISSQNTIDVLINNAARTVDHTPQWLDAMKAIDASARAQLPPSVRDRLAETPATHATIHALPPGELDDEGQPADTRERTAWRAKIGAIPLQELLAVTAVNALAPFVLVDRLRANMCAGDGRARFIVNVTSPEGRFYRRFKGPWHPHTNMAKAALDMLTRTCAEDLANESVFMCSVDPGWVSDLHTSVAREAIGRAERWEPPVSMRDAALRILDPIFAALDGDEPAWGVVLRNFAPCPW
ncbi:MAG: SDR family oxidoreductase [Polyangiales bacterium]